VPVGGRRDTWGVDTDAVVLGQLRQQRARRHWRHLVVAFVGGTCAAVGELGVIAAIVGDGASVATRARLPMFVAVFALGALVASFGWQRFNARRALTHYPYTVISVGLLVPLLWASSAADDRPQPDQEAGANTRAVVSVFGDSRTGPGLAAALIDVDLASSLMGPAFDQPGGSPDWLVRGHSMIRYRGNGRYLTLTVARQPRKARTLVTDRPRGRSRGASATGAMQDWVIQVSLLGLPPEEAAPQVERLLEVAKGRLQGALQLETATGRGAGRAPAPGGG